jgi:predicted Zn-dependent protease
MVDFAPSTDTRISPIACVSRRWLKILSATLILGLSLSSHAADTTSGRERFELQRDLAYALEQTERSSEAIDLYKGLIRNRHATDRERYQLAKRLAYALDAMGDHLHAAVEFEALLASPVLLAADAQALRTALAHNLHKNGQYRRAVWQWQQVLDGLADGDPEIAVIQLRMADLFEKLNQDTAAAAIYANLLGSSVDGEDLRYRYAWLLNRNEDYKAAWTLLKAWPRPHPEAKLLSLQAQTAFWAEADEAALTLYPMLLKQQPKGKEPLAEGKLAQYAQLLRRNGRMTEAADTLAQLVSRSPANSDYRILLVDTYLDTQNSAAAEPHLVVLLAEQSAQPRIQLLAARVYAELEQPAKAIQHLKSLHRIAPLSPDLQVWLGDLLRATGRNDEARSAYAAAIRQAPDDIPARARVALADLAFDDGDYALAMANYTQAVDSLSKTTGHRAEVQLKIARTASRLNDQKQARQAYADYLKAHPMDGEIRLELARVLSAQGAHGEAVGHYRKVVAQQSENGIEMELARAFMAAEAYAEAETYARKALANHQAEPEAIADEPRRLLAEILLYSGQAEAADQLIDTYLQDYPEDPAAILLQAETALAMDRKLLAYTRFADARAAGIEETERLSLGLGQSALGRGDLLRAGREIEPLEGNPSPTDKATALMEAYRRAAAPRLGLRAGWNTDSNDLIVRHMGLQGSATGPYHLPIDLRYTVGEVEQDDTDFQRQAISLGTRAHFFQPNLSAEGYVGIEAVGDADHENGATLPIGEVVVRRYWLDDSSIGVGLTRETIWTAHDSPDLHRYHRITRLAEVEPAFARTDVRLLVDKRLGDGGRFWQATIGGDVYSDNNSRLWGYTHLQQPLMERPGRWVALKPNLFYEGFSNTEDPYFSPEHHLSLGLIGQAIAQIGFVAVDLEANPQLLVTDGETGWGGHWHLKLTTEWRHLFAGGGIFGFYDHNDDYLLWRMVGQVGWRF